MTFKVMIAALLGLAGVAHATKPDDVEMVTEWYITVTENEVERSMQPVEPGDGSFKFGIDQELAPGWSCEVRPQVWHGTRRWRWMTCRYRAERVQVRTDCRSDRTSSKSQELWIGDNVSVRLSCRSGVSP